MIISKRKRYLSGLDWAINTLDYAMKSATCSGNMSQIVLLFDSRIDEEKLRASLNQVVSQLPVLNGHVARDLKLAPYWNIPAAARKDVSLFVHTHDFLTADELLPLLTESANSAFQDDTDHIAFHFFTNASRSALAMIFDHRLLDARGAESFLFFLERSLKGQLPSGDGAFTSSCELTNWKRKFLAGKTINRRVIALSKSLPRSLQIPENKKSRFLYRLLAFNEQETAIIYDRAYQEAGYLMESPFFLAVLTQSMHELMLHKSGDGSSYVIPVTIDLRQGTDSLAEIFFNHFSFLFYQVPVHAAENRKELIDLFKQQMYDQIKTGFPRDLAEASLLTRIVPLGVLGRLFSAPFKGKIATFAFSHLGKSAYQSTGFLDSTITDFFHMPRVPMPPGIGFFSNIYKGRLNLVISYLEGMLTNTEMRMLETAIRKRFGVVSE
ncbi:MAG: hypothetical protein WC539_03690 [Nitrospirota bacterium]